MNLGFLPLKIQNALINCDLDKLNELRIRVNYNIKVVYSGESLYLGEQGLTLLKSNALICGQDDINEIIKKSTEYSVYAHNQRIKQGYLSVKGGVRIGIAGECVFENNANTTIKNITSLNIRFPHLIKNCSNLFFDKIFFNEKLLNTLIISPPFYGKTTMLKDLCIKLDALNLGSILIVDERGEFDNICGENIDIIRFCDKFYAFEYAIRSLAPKIIVCDELSLSSDWVGVEEIINSGVKVIASCHSLSVDELTKKKNFNNIFDRYILLSNKVLGGVKGVYNNNFSLL